MPEQQESPTDPQVQKWIADEMTSFLPGPSKALYWSIGHPDKDIERLQIDLLAVVAGAIAGVRFTEVHEHWNALNKVPEFKELVHCLPGSAVETVSSEFTLLRPPESEPRRRGDVHITMKRELGPWGAAILLPLSPQDYDNQRAVAWTAALVFGRALAGEMR